MARAADSSRAAAVGEVGEPELRQLLVGLTAVRDGDFGTRLPDEADGLLRAAGARRSTRMYTAAVDEVPSV